VLLNNNDGDALAAAQRVRQLFETSIPAVAGQLTDLRANFAGPDAQGTRAYVDQITLDHPEIELAVARADCQLAIRAFCGALIG
jgi:hypothetical protein